MLSSLTGGFGILIGAQTMAMSSQHVEGDPPSWATVVTFASGVWCTLAAIVATEYREVAIRHHSLLYLVAGAISPVWLTSSAPGVRTMVMHEGVVGRTECACVRRDVLAVRRRGAHQDPGGGGDVGITGPGAASVPVAIPSAGRYRNYVQVRRSRVAIETSALDVAVPG